MRYHLIIGALLHDIGKIIYRSLQDGSVKKDHRHQELGAAWANESGLDNRTVEIIRRHHNLRFDEAKYQELSVEAFQGEKGLHNDLYVVDSADNIASGMERQKDRKGGKFQPKIPLRSIFDRININENEAVKGEYYWPATPLTDLPYPQQEEVNNTAENYRKIWVGFLEDFESIKEEVPDEEKLLTILQNYLFAIPEHTFVTEESPETSLFHHLKTTCAIAYCNYLYLTGEKGVEWEAKDLSKLIYDREEQRYQLVAADFSGIQNFVYTLSSKGALKTLRARSFYLNFLQECAATQLIEKFGLPRSCIIFAGGGGFYILAPNTAEVKDGLKEFRDELNDSFFERFGTSIFLALDSITLSGEDLSGGTGYLEQAWGEVKSKVNLQKSRKWYNKVQGYDYLFAPIDPPWYKCTSCRYPVYRSEDDEVEEEIQCPFCRKMTKWSRKLGEINAVYEVKSEIEGERILPLGKSYFCFDPNPEDQIKRCYLMKNFWKPDGKSNYPVLNFFQGSFYTQSVFQELVSHSYGIQRLGILRMDVDFLGKVFSRGLKNPTFASINDLSERLNMYFNYYLPELLGKEFQDKLLPTPQKKLNVNLVYSGGDDLLLVGTWDSALETAYQIQKDFKAFTGNNDSLNFSGGLVITHEKIAFYKQAEMAGEAENMAKDEGRNRLCLFGRTFSWERVKGGEGSTISYLISLFLEGVRWTESKARPVAFSRSFLQKLLFLAQEYRKNRDLWVFPQMHYLFARNMGKEKKFYKSLLALIMQESTFRQELIPALQIVDYLTRGGENE